MTAYAEENAYDISDITGPQIQYDYEQNRTDAWSQIEELGITKRIISVCKSSLPSYCTSLNGLYSEIGPAEPRSRRQLD